MPFPALRLFAATILIPAALASRAAAEPFELRDGDRVALLGGMFIEREAAYGYVELALSTHWPDRRIVFRNLGWSGETVFGDARAAFDTAKEGYKRMLDQARDVEPTVILMNFGWAESHKGEAGLEEFRAGLDRLLDDLQPLGARTAILSLFPIERKDPPQPDPEGANRNIALYNQLLRETAARRGLVFADISALTAAGAAGRKPELTTDGMRLTAYGYWRAGQSLKRALGLVPAEVAAPEPAEAPGSEWTTEGRAGQGAEFEKEEKLRRAIIAKNELYFHRYRPQNQTYLFGFRKHEQGQNAKEIPMFDPLVAEADRIIGEARAAFGPAAAEPAK